MVTRLRSLLPLFLCLLLCSSLLRAQRVQLDLPSVVEVGEPFQLVYTYTGQGAMAEVSAPSLGGLRLLYGPVVGEGFRSTSINGRVSNSKFQTLTYTLQADKAGTYTIGTCVVAVGGKRLSVAGARTQATASSRRSRPAGSAGSRPLQPSSYHYVALPNARSVYEQQAFPVLFRFYASSEFSLRRAEPPMLDGFSSEILDDGGQKKLFLDRYQGKDMRASDLVTAILIPQRSGQLSIAPAEVTVLVRQEPDLDQESLDELFSYTPQQERTFRSPATPITVRPLPEAGRPEDFSGAVGSFTLHAEVLTKRPQTEQPLTLRLTLRGSGNLKTSTPPAVAFPESFEVDAPQETYQGQVTSQELRAEKIIDYTAVPKYTGQVKLPPVRFSYFDPQQGRYVTLQSPAFTLEVTRGQTQAQEGRRTMRHAEALLLSLYPETHHYAPRGWRLATSWGYYGLFPLLVLLALGGYGYVRREQRLRADTWGYRSGRASRVATRRLRLAHQYLQQGEREPFYEALLSALWGYLGDKLRLPVSELSRGAVAEILRERGLTEEDIQLLTDVVDEVEFARYVPSEQVALQQHYDRVATVISRIDQQPL